jgi:hypothetical protein
MPRKRSLTARFWAKGTAPETAIHLPGGRLVVPGHAKSDSAVAKLVAAALAKGSARIEAKK